MTPTDRCIVLLAAGASRRYGGIKLLAPIGGVPMIRRCAQAALAACPDLVVVTGAHDDAVRSVLRDLPLELVHHRHWADGMGSSIGAAFSHLLARRAPPALAGIGLGDQPRVGATQWQAVLSRGVAEPGHIVAAAHGPDGVFGPPCVFPQGDFAALAALRGDIGAKPLLRASRTRVCVIAMPEAAFDVDRPADLLHTAAGDDAQA